MYMKVFGHQTTTGRLRLGKIVIIAAKKKNPFLNKFFCVENFTLYSHNLYAVFGKKKK